MRAYSTSSGAAMFVPDEIERKTVKVSYADLVEEKPAEARGFGALFFGKRKPKKEALRQAA